jgi:hypothetical protein
MPLQSSHNMYLRLFTTSGIVTTFVLVLIGVYSGWDAVLTALMLIVIELTFSLDNAIVNARVLTTMSPFWRRMFMTVGIIIAVFGMRIVFPVLIVVFTSGLPWNDVVRLAFDQPEKYATVLQLAHPGIATFGGMFLLMLSLHFFFDSVREIRWLERFERGMQYVGREGAHVVVCAIVLAVISVLPANHSAHETLIAGLTGIITYLAIHGLSEFILVPDEGALDHRRKVAVAGVVSFLYLEVLDASFSFDGVIGAFAITKNVVLIAAGLGVGALWVRSLTLFIVRKKALQTYRYLEHGAHYVIGVLALTLLVSLFYDIPQMLAGIIGVVVIGASVVSSVRDNKKDDVVHLV